MLMPFGKYAGLPLGAVPVAYLEWVSTREINHELREVVLAELQRRRAGAEPATPEEVHELFHALAERVGRGGGS